MPRVIGVAAALHAEARLFGHGWRTDTTSNPQSRLVVRVTGVGAQRAGDGAKALLEAGASVLVSFGFAAGLAPELGPGTLVLPRQVLGEDGRAHATDTALRARLIDRLRAHATCDDTLVETRAPLWDGAAKQVLHARSGAVAADMESVAIAAVAARFVQPFLAVRAIVDAAERDVPLCTRRSLGGDGSVRFGELCAGLARRPWELFALLRLARDFGTARRALVEAATALSALASEPA